MRRIVFAALAALSLLAGVTHAQNTGTNSELRNGYCFNSTTGQMVDCNTGQVLTREGNPLSGQQLSPTLIYSGVILAGASDSSSIVDLSGYRTVALLVQVGGMSTNNWQRFAVNARYNLSGLSDSLSLFSIPVMVHDDSALVSVPAGRIAGAAAGVLAAHEFPITIVATNNGATASTRSLPQGKVVYLSVPPGFVWPARCSFRFANIGRTLSTFTNPTLRVWVMGTAL